jgi:dienelactone hydrolase
VNNSKRSTLIALLALATLILSGCSNSNDGGAEVPGPVSYDALGPYPVANSTVSIVNHAEGRVLNVEIWYPASASGGEQTILDFATSAMERDNLTALLDENPGNCVRQDTSSSASQEPAQSPARFPLVVFSHCFECTRFSSFSLAERLASHGIAVAAPDHAMNTLFDSGAMLTAEFLAIRASDMAAVVDELLIPNSAALPANLQGRFDASRVGVAGHSFGALTTGKLLQDDARFKAGLIIAAPVENPLIPGVAVARIQQPTLYLIATEDNSIGEIGNIFMRSNFDAAASPSWKVEVADAGHWSFSDLAGIVPGFRAGCGDGVRQTIPGELFTYIDNSLALDIAASYGTRFFAAHLLGDETALQELGKSTHPGVVDVQVK